MKRPKNLVNPVSKSILPFVQPSKDPSSKSSSTTFLEGTHSPGPVGGDVGFAVGGRVADGQKVKCVMAP